MSAAKRRSLPDDFPEQLARLGSMGCANHYRTSLTTVTRWRREAAMAPGLRTGERPGSRPSRAVRCVETNEVYPTAALAQEWLTAKGVVRPKVKINIGPALARGIRAYGYHWVYA